MAIGAVALAVAAFMAWRWKAASRPMWTDYGSQERFARVVQASRSVSFVDGFQKLQRKGGSPWVAGMICIGVGLPSPDYMGVLAIIATSGSPLYVQALALVTFVVVCSLVVLVPLAGLFLAPRQTLALAARFVASISSRSQIEYAALLAVVGCLLILHGYSSYDRFSRSGSMAIDPPFTWHLANVGNYVDLSPAEVLPKTVDGVASVPPSSGSGLNGLPHDFLSSSGLLLAFEYSEAIQQYADDQPRLELSWQIIDMFGILPGSVMIPTGEPYAGG